MNMSQSLEEKILEQVVRPALGPIHPDHLGSMHTTSQTLDFVKLLNLVKEFYKKNGGEKWCDVVLASEI